MLTDRKEPTNHDDLKPEQPGPGAVSPAGKVQSDTLEEAYYDRNQAVLLAARLAKAQGWPMGVKGGYPDTAWPLLYIETPAGQVAWHIPELELVGNWPEFEGEWDGHDLTEKRQRLLQVLSGDLP